MENFKNKIIENWVIAENQPITKKLETLYSILVFYSFSILMIICILSIK